MANIDGICEVLKGKVRGNPIAVTFFEDKIPDGYEGVKVEPCGILKHAMDDGKSVYFDKTFNDCSHGTYLMGLDEGNDLMRSGEILYKFIPSYEESAAKAVNSGKFRLPSGLIKGIGAAPLNNVPNGMDIKWIVVVCTPKEACLIAAARSVKDGIMPSTAAGNSFCTDVFATPWFENNVVMTPGDMGGRMANKLKPEEMFVIIPIEYADNLIEILGARPDVKGIFEATKPEHSDYWVKKRAKEERAKARETASENTDSKVEDNVALAKKYGLKTSMDWDEEAMQLICKAPKFVRGFAVGNVEDFAEENSYKVVTLAVVNEQMDKAGTRKYMNFGSDDGDKKPGFFSRLFSKK